VSRLRRQERHTLVEMRLAEIRGVTHADYYGSLGDAMRSLRQRHMVRSISSRWVESLTGGRIRVESYQLTDRGRASADQLIYNRDQERRPYQPGDWFRKTAHQEPGFSARRARRFEPGPTPEEWKAETFVERHAAIMGASKLIRTFEEAYPTVAEWRRYIEAPSHVGQIPRHPRLIPSDREPLDKMIRSLDSGYSFADDAHRRVRAFESARREHDAGDEDDGAIERCARECERQLRAQIVGNGTLLAEPVRYQLQSMPWTVDEHALEAARREEPLDLINKARLHDEAEERALAAAYGLFAVDKRAEKPEDGSK